MSLPADSAHCLNFFGAPLVAEPLPGQLSGDAGLRPIRQLDQRIGLTRSFADALDDPRDPRLTEHVFVEMVRSRVYGILSGRVLSPARPPSPNGSVPCLARPPRAA